MSFDPRVLGSLPLVDEATSQAVTRVLVEVVEQRLLPDFARDESVDPVRLARVSERYRIARWEDVTDRLNFVSLLASEDDRWTILIHERIFDYIAFGLPGNPSAVPPSESPEARKVLALAEIILRHQLDHMIHPERDEFEVIEADCAFVTTRRAEEPAFDAALHDALTDPTNGLEAEPYLELFDACSVGHPVDGIIRRMVAAQLAGLAEAPTSLLVGLLPTLGLPLRAGLAEACLARVRDPGLRVSSRARALESLQTLLERERGIDLGGLRAVFDACTARWGPGPLLAELEADRADETDPDQAFLLLVSRLEEIRRQAESETERDEIEPRPRTAAPTSEGARRPTLEERIEAARRDPRVPEAVLSVVDANAANLGGHSKVKYAELIDTLLRIPWGRIRPIDVGPRELAAGLAASHFGLERPKDLLTDFFSNLIWRYRQLDPGEPGHWRRTGSAFLLVGPPGVGKTSLAVALARTLGLPFHKISLGGMRDESDLRGHGFTYEGSKPGGIVQGLLRMGAMNGIFILDEADKTQPFAIATLLEILDPEQNHLFHDRYAQTTVDIDLSNCHFFLTANTLETVPAPVVDRCQVIRLERYAVEEKVAIARDHILPRLRRQLALPEEVVELDPGREDELLRLMVRDYTQEAGVRQLELVLRSLLLRVHRRDLVEGGRERVRVSRHLLRARLETPLRPRVANTTDRVGEVLGLGVDAERGIGAVIPIQATRVPGARPESGGVSMIEATGNIERVMDESRKVATTAILHCGDRLGVSEERAREPVHLHFMGASTRKDGPSAGAAIAVALVSLLTDRVVRRDVAVTGEIDTQGRVSEVGGLDVKLETAARAGCSTVVVPRDNLDGPEGVEGLPAALRRELQVLDISSWRAGTVPFEPDRHTLQVVGVEHISEAVEVAVLDPGELASLEDRVTAHARAAAAAGRAPDAPAPVTVLKDPADLEEGHFSPQLCEGCGGCRLLLPKGAEAVADSAAEHGADVATATYDLADDGVARALADELGKDPAAVIGPYFALRTALRSLDRSPGAVLLAANRTAQGHKLGRARAAVHRLFCRLLRSGFPLEEPCPILSPVDGVWISDLGSLPDRWWLDRGRSEELVERLAGLWVSVYEEELVRPAVPASR